MLCIDEYENIKVPNQTSIISTLLLIFTTGCLPFSDL